MSKLSFVSSQSRENWVRLKYLDKTFVKPLINPFIFKCSQFNNVNKENFVYLNFKNNNNNNDDIQIDNENQLLHYAALYSDLKLILYAISLNADRNSIDVYSNNQTPLIKAVLSVSVCQWTKINFVLNSFYFKRVQ